MSDHVDDDGLARPPLLPAGLPDVRESDDAGRYYCAHALFFGHLAVERGIAPLVRDEHGDPLVGFLHVPPDPQTRGAASDASDDDERHGATRRVVAAALAGWVRVLARALEDEPARVVLTGFGSFRDVVDNPTGAFVRSRDDVEAALALAFGDDLRSLSFVADGDVRAEVLVEGRPRSLALSCASLPVDDRALAFRGEGSLLSSLEEEARAHAWLGLGVCRSPFYRVETLPHDGGLLLDDEGGRHDDGREPTRFPRGSRALVRAMERGGVVVGAR
jgi:hypothetical protein